MLKELSDQEIIYDYIKGLEVEINERLDLVDDALVDISKETSKKQYFGTPSSNSDGDMKKSRYDSNDDGIVDEAEAITNQ